MHKCKIVVIVTVLAHFDWLGGHTILLHKTMAIVAEVAHFDWLI